MTDRLSKQPPRWERQQRGPKTPLQAAPPSRGLIRCMCQTPGPFGTQQHTPRLRQNYAPGDKKRPVPHYVPEDVPPLGPTEVDQTARTPAPVCAQSARRPACARTTRGKEDNRLPSKVGRIKASPSGPKRPHPIRALSARRPEGVIV